MGLFSSECNHCGSKEHSSSDCPHGIFSTKCKHCGSVEHSSSDCPHGIFSSKCKHCGSTEHSSSDCPHGMFSAECKHCGSVNHSSNDCPQGLFATREKSSSNYTSSSTSAEEDGVRAVFFFIKWGIIITVALFIIMIAIFLAPLGLLVWYLIDKRKTQWIAIVGMLFATYLIYDISSGGFITENMMHLQKDGSEKYLTLGYFIILATTLGFFIEKYSSTNIPVLESGNFFTKKDIKKRRPLIAGLSILLLSIFLIFNFVDFSSNNSYPKNKTKAIKKSVANPIVQINKEAYIKADPYANIRKGTSTDYDIIKSLNKGEKIFLIDQDNLTNWYKVRLNDNSKGYISNKVVSFDFVSKNSVKNSKDTPKISINKTVVNTPKYSKAKINKPIKKERKLFSEVKHLLIEPCSYKFSSFSIGDDSSDILGLHEFLNKNPKTKLANNGLNSPGNEGSLATEMTTKALEKFQKLYGLEVNGKLNKKTQLMLEKVCYKWNEQKAKIKYNVIGNWIIEGSEHEYQFNENGTGQNKTTNNVAVTYTYKWSVNDNNYLVIRNKDYIIDYIDENKIICTIYGGWPRKRGETTTFIKK